MPIISTIGRRSFKVRLLIGSIYALLTIGALSMIYPFTLMLSGSIKSETDISDISPIPKFWFSDDVLFRKYVESKYNGGLAGVDIGWGRKIVSWQKLHKPPEEDFQYVEPFRQWRQHTSNWTLGHCGGFKLLPRNARVFRSTMQEHFGDDNIQAFVNATDLPIRSWTELNPPAEGVFRFPPEKEGLMGLFRPFADKQPARDRIILNPDGEFRYTYVRTKYPDIDALNKAAGAKYRSYEDVFLTRTPPKNPILRKMWEEYVRDDIELLFIHFSPSLKANYHDFLIERYGTIEEYNKQTGNNAASFDAVVFPTSLPEKRAEQVIWEGFLRDAKRCPIEAVSLHTTRHDFEDFLAAQTGKTLDQLGQINMPIAAADYRDCMDNSSDLRWEFTTRNYKQVFDYVILHGRGVINTVIYCGLMILLALTVNPLAAYALSRYKPPSTYTVLLICMATMSFPNEVTMIPAFLLLKKFPLWPILTGLGSFLVAAWVLSKFLRNLSDNLKLGIAILFGILVGGVLVPFWVLKGSSNVSLLNTFAALVLPGAANGYSIFLLKGFFDSLPRELYEAADLDGASEWTKFWSMTMNLSKPILAVIALSAFTAAYSQFMMALIIIPDQNMWTLMVWIFQLQSISHQAVIYAALVIGAIPTFIVFVFAQGVIMRGIVVPVEK
ncbi:MAG: carbohydrate ABC transporter permease [Phycisphaerae bacterium]|nr:carbohydrate ABC transporter permease [Phycisphaerae bacterium]